MLGYPVERRARTLYVWMPIPRRSRVESNSAAATHQRGLDCAARLRSGPRRLRRASALWRRASAARSGERMAKAAYKVLSNSPGAHRHLERLAVRRGRAIHQDDALCLVKANGRNRASRPRLAMPRASQRTSWRPARVVSTVGRPSPGEIERATTGVRSEESGNVVDWRNGLGEFWLSAMSRRAERWVRPRPAHRDDTWLWAMGLRCGVMRRT